MPFFPGVSHHENIISCAGKTKHLRTVDGKMPGLVKSARIRLVASSYVNSETAAVRKLSSSARSWKRNCAGELRSVA
jgi:hypothetical protein